MKFRVEQNFKIIVKPNEVTKLVDDITAFEYYDNEVIDENSGIKYTVLKQIEDGDLIPFLEYQIIASIPLFKQTTDPETKENIYEFYGVPAIEIDTIDELAGENELQYPFLTILEDGEEFDDEPEAENEEK